MWPGRLLLATAGAASLLYPVSAFAAPLSQHKAHLLFGNTHPATAQYHVAARTAARARGSSSSSTAQQNGLHMSLLGFRGGAMTASAAATSKLASLTETPSALFNTALISLAFVTTVFKVLQRTPSSSDNSTQGIENKKPASVKSLQTRFLTVFWLLRCADWLQGPYFYQVYASKIFNGVPASLDLVSKLFLTGFASTALLGPFVGRAADTYGRKKGTLAFCLLYALGAASTKSPLLVVLLLGRFFSGVGTSLLFSAPEAWLVGESQKSGDDPDGKYLGETFGLAYAGDSIVAILAGQFAGVAAASRGPTGPFELSVGFLAFGAIMSAFLWKENVASKASSDSDSTSSSSKPSIKDAVNVIKGDRKIMLVGATQSLFEAAMYIFVLQWPPAITAAISKAFGEGAATPYGAIFSCFMACCLLGSTTFSQFAKMGDRITTEQSSAGMLFVATAAMGLATFAASSSGAAALTMPLAALMGAFFAFEACVGMYFPSIGTLRSKYIPDSHRSVIMNLFGIPLNVLVVSVFLSIKRLGLTGALGISTGALGLAATSMFTLQSMLGDKKAKGGADVAA